MIIIFILAMLLCVRPPAIFLRTDHATWRQGGRSPGLEVETSVQYEGKSRLNFVYDQEERLLSRAEGREERPSHDDQAQGTGDHTTSEDDCWRVGDAKKAEEIEIEQLQRELFTSASQNAELQRQIENLSKDLESARSFPTTADTYSDSEVIQMLQRLNAELQHISTVMADRVLSAFKLEHDFATFDPERQVMVNRVSESVGSTLVQSFRAVQPDDLPMYLQIAFQAHLAHHLCWIVSFWTLDQGHSSFIEQIYQRLRDKGRRLIFRRYHLC